MSAISDRLHSLFQANLILLLFFLVIGGLYIARAFLIPLAFAAIFAMLMTPLCSKLEATGINRALATLLCILLLLVFFFGLGTLLSAQIASFSEDLPQIEKQITQQLTQVQQFIQENFGISPQEQKKAVQEESPSGSRGMIVDFLGSFTSILASSLLMLVYLFMIMHYRDRFLKFVLKVVSEDKKDRARHVITDSSQVAQQYLVGRGILILILAIMYSIGFLIIGIDNAVLISLLAALVSIIPYIGNVIGVSFPLFMALTQGGDIWLFIGVLIVFSIVQFVESYVLEPYIVGAEVDIHPFFTIVVIVAGEMIWGIAGMILAIPLFGILKIIFDNIESLQPYGYLIGDSEGEGGTRIGDKIKGWFL